MPISVTKKANTVAVIVREGGGIEILSNGKKIFPAGGKDNNPTATHILALAEPLAMTEEIEDSAIKVAFRAALADQVKHVVSLNLPAPNQPIPTCGQMEEKIIELQAMAASVTGIGQREFLERIISSDMKILHAVCPHGGGRL
jgi:hypothetical protein